MISAFGWPRSLPASSCEAKAPAVIESNLFFVSLEVPVAPRVERAASFGQMRSGLTNDRVYALLDLYQDVFAATPDEKDAQDWQRLRALVAALCRQLMR
jgi:hypothetical protein